MAHWRTFLESDVIRYVDLQDREFTLRITKVAKGKVTGSGGKQSGKAMITFEGKEKPLAAGTAILNQIAALYGNDVASWTGKLITIYPDPSVTYGGAAVGGIRVRNAIPKESKAKAPVMETTDQPPAEVAK